MFLLYKFARHPSILRTIRSDFSRLTEPKHTIFSAFRSHLKRYKFQYAAVIVCATGTSAFLYSNSSAFIQNYFLEHEPVNVPTRLASAVPTSKYDDDANPPIDILSLRTFGSLIFADLPYLFLAILVGLFIKKIKLLGCVWSCVFQHSNPTSPGRSHKCPFKINTL